MHSVTTPNVFAFDIVGGLNHQHASIAVSRSFRNALLARVRMYRDCEPAAGLPTFYSGHQADGTPARHVNHGHLSYWFDPDDARLYAVAPHYVLNREPTAAERQHLRELPAIFKGLDHINAGASGVLRVQSVTQSGEWPWEQSDRVWKTVFPYTANRRCKQKVSSKEALRIDCLAAMQHFGYPSARIVIDGPIRKIKGLLLAHLRLVFDAKRSGPIALGRDWHFGGGVFKPATARRFDKL